MKKLSVFLIFLIFWGCSSSINEDRLEEETWHSNNDLDETNSYKNVIAKAIEISNLILYGNLSMRMVEG